ncbi:MAG: hypothetical protein VKN56_06715 [Cyanobacteriota bacterium]|nr:hypothetical protein [Cyanobacteriota bacterium]
MTQAKTGVFLSMGRLPQFVGQAALAASVLAGGASLLNAGGAMAAPIAFPPPYPGQPPVGPDGVTTVGAGGPTVGLGTVNLAYSGLLGGKPTYQVDTDFDGPPAGSDVLPGPYSGTFRYTINSAVSPFNFAGLSQNIVEPSSGASVTKQVCYGGFGVDCEPLLSVLNAGSTTLNLSKTVNTLYITDTYTGTSTAAVDNFINTYQTPGPLPILGAGAAFGFSRKLRSRIKAGRTA